MLVHRQLTVTTADGWRLPLHRLGRRSGDQPTPVLLLHGLFANGHCLYDRNGRSLASYLAEQGFDTWSLEFRGTQDSRHPRGQQAYQAITADQKIEHDLPSAVAAVQGYTQAASVDVVGHSLGGTVLYAYLEQVASAPIRRGVTISAAIRYALPPLARVLGRLAAWSWGRRLLPAKVPMRRFSLLGAQTNLVFPARRHFNLANMDRAALLRLMRQGIEDAPTAELLQLLQRAWPGDDGHGSNPLAQRLGAIRQPLRLIGGAADQHCPPARLQEVLARLGSHEKSLVVVGRSLGARYDYGHTDLLLGPRAEQEVFPHVSDWLRRR